MKTTPWPPVRSNARLALFLCALAFVGSAQAQWVWRDASGNTTFSDSPPPAGVAPSDILRQPTVESSTDTNSNTPASSDRSDASSAPSANLRADGSAPAPAAAPTDQASKPPASAKTLAEQEADFRKRLAEREKAEQKEAEDETKATQRNAACNQAKTYLQMLEEGTRLLRPDAEGNRNFLDDDQRAAEVQKTQDVISKNC